MVGADGASLRPSSAETLGSEVSAADHKSGTAPCELIRNVHVVGDGGVSRVAPSLSMLSSVLT
jgi:hypothetical protein